MVSSSHWGSQIFLVHETVGGLNPHRHNIETGRGCPPPTHPLKMMRRKRVYCVFNYCVITTIQLLSFLISEGDCLGWIATSWSVRETAKCKTLPPSGRGELVIHRFQVFTLHSSANATNTQPFHKLLLIVCFCSSPRQLCYFRSTFS